MPLRGKFDEVPSMLDAPAAGGRSRAASDPPRAPRASRHATSSAPGPSRTRSTRKQGLAVFFKNLWDMCRTTLDVANKSLELSQETCRRQNEYLAAHGRTVPPVGAELDPIPRPNFQMPPLDEDIFHGIENFGGFVPPPAAGDDEDDDDEDGDGMHSEADAPSDDF